MKRISQSWYKAGTIIPTTYFLYPSRPHSDQRDRPHFKVPQRSLQTSWYDSTSSWFHDDKDQDIQDLLIKLVNRTHRSDNHSPLIDLYLGICKTKTIHYPRPRAIKSGLGTVKEQKPPLASAYILIRAVAADINLISRSHIKKKKQRDFTAKPIHLWLWRKQNPVSTTLTNDGLCKWHTDDVMIAAVANEVATSLAPIRAIQHRDSQGNPIGSFFSSAIARIFCADLFSL